MKTIKKNSPNGIVYKKFITMKDIRKKFDIPANVTLYKDFGYGAIIRIEENHKIMAQWTKLEGLDERDS